MALTKTRPADICVLAYSQDHIPQHDHFELIARCLNSIVAHTPAGHFHLHVGCNHLSDRAMQLVDRLVERGLATKYVGKAHQDAAGSEVYPKYPLQREIFAATSGDWVIWLDDDSHVTQDDWLPRLEEVIERRPDVHQWGRLAWWTSRPTPQRLRWIEQAAWYRPEMGKRCLKTPEGLKLSYPFILGAFFALSRDAIQRCSIPDPRLFHNHGDVTTGMSLFYQELQMAEHDYGVAVDDAPRRGMHRDLWHAPGEAARGQAKKVRQQNEEAG